MAPKCACPAVVKSSPNKKKVKKEKDAPPAPIPMPALTVSGNPLEPEQIQLALRCQVGVPCASSVLAASCGVAL